MLRPTKLLALSRLPWFAAAVGLVIGASIVVRLGLLGRQSYWFDEVFSVHQSSGSLSELGRVAATEVHPPLFSVLLWAWIHVVGTHATATRLFSALCTVAAVWVAHRGLRHVRIDPHVRWALTTATAAAGTSIVYSLEIRSYALLLLGAVGLTATTLRAAERLLDGAGPGRRTALTWLAWSLLAATTHLFGAILTAGAAGVLVAVEAVSAHQPGGRRAGWWRRPLAWVGLAAAGTLPQALWLLLGLRRPGFAAGTAWIEAPDPADLWELLTTTFAAGGLTMRRDGFAWLSPLGVLAAAALVAIAALARVGTPTGSGPGRGTTDRGTTDRGTAGGEGRSAAVLLGLAAVVVGGSFAVAQWRHVWTLRNLVVVSPALLWGTICLAAAVAGGGAARRRVAAAALALLALGLGPVTVGVARPYKTDVRGLFDELVTLREAQPQTTVVFLGQGPPPGWEAASDRPDPAAGHRLLDERIVVTPARSPDRVIPPPGPAVVVLYPGVEPTHLDHAVAAMLDRFGPDRCRRVRLHGLAVVRCT